MTEISWCTALSDVDQNEIRDLIDEATCVDGIAPVGEQVLRQLGEERTGHLVARDADGRIVGYLNLNLGPDPSEPTAELAVRPEARRRGVGSALARAAQQRSGGPVRFWAHGTLPAARELARSLNLTPVRELVQMRRPLHPVPDAPAPQGVRVAAYTGAGDHAELLRVNNAAFAWHPEQGGWTDTHLAERLTAPWFDPEGLLLAFDENSGDLLGFHWTKVHDDRLGEVYVLGVDPAAQGRGLGRALTLAGLRHLAGRLDGRRGAEVMLYVESDNAAALNTYRKLGFTPAAVDTAYAL